jgi:polynucleotide 5'-hydroxyl-kinase GRC3/NOL9
MQVTMVRGPATVRVDGSCMLLGMDVSGRTLKVRAGKALPFEPLPACKLVVQAGEVWEADPLRAGTEMWAGTAERILGMSKRRLAIMIVGATDTGKSTLSTYLTNKAIERGILPCVVDGDMGQGDLAPPAALGAALVREQVADLRDVEAGYYEFVGSVTASGSERLVAAKMKSLLARTRRISHLHIINTDGYVADGGAAYKRMLARAVAPDVIVSLGPDSLASFLSRGRWLFLHARSSGQVAKTRSDRLGRRMDQFMRHVGEGHVSVPPEKRSFTYRARQISFANVIRYFSPESIQGMFVGLGKRGAVVGFGIIEGLDDSLYVRAGVQDFDTIHLSNILLRNGREQRFIS